MKDRKKFSYAWYLRRVSGKFQSSYNRCFLLVIISGLALFSSCQKPADKASPNIIYILADDLGYGELGIYGQERIETPHLDSLAASGMIFTQHYSGAPVCAPSRCVLLTGQHTGHAYVRGNDEWGERGKVWDYRAMYENPHLEGQRPLPDSIVTIAEVLQQAGYKTGMVGKWGLGAPGTEGVPNKQGFDFFYGYNCQRQAHTYYPMHLWHNESRDTLDNKFVELHANFPHGEDPYDLNNYADFNLNEYAPDLMHREAIRFIHENSDQPFFLYYASPIPHLPLQAPKKWVDYYRNKWGEEEPYTGTSYFPCRYPRATYAGMISYLDEQVGELVSTLREMGLLENTIIMFSSDNGPTYTGGADTPYFESAKPFKTEYGWGKGFTHEGGIRVPMIASWQGKIVPGSSSEHISAFQDVYPTICDIAGIPIPGTLDGISFFPELLGENQDEHEYLFWDFPEYGGQQAVRMGTWKGIRKDVKKGNMSIELFDLNSDIREQKNVADQYPDVVNQMKEIMLEARTIPEIDRFKMEALGDVKTTVIEARERLKSHKPGEITQSDRYFTLSRNTSYYLPDGYEKVMESLQDKLRMTGSYEMKFANHGEAEITIQLDKSLNKEEFEISIDESGIEISATHRQGMTRAVEVIIQLMDPKINRNLEMHNPTWIIAGGSIKL